eukprot:TRINITY_DN25686_c0_g1_i1.p2 TRINITY_DN25686_c0_g1~~TRINITY_DN25686_c0_g1_i1.p2  ORF type:complete len:114 (+),score=41.88 TRINITY_DN25686_c0_g1_i1:49-342(+)
MGAVEEDDQAKDDCVCVSANVDMPGAWPEWEHQGCKPRHQVSSTSGGSPDLLSGAAGFGLGLAASQLWESDQWYWEWRRIKQLLLWEKEEASIWEPQ